MFRWGTKGVRGEGVVADGDEEGRRRKEVAIAREVIHLNISTRASRVGMCGNSYTDTERSSTRGWKDAQSTG